MIEQTKEMGIQLRAVESGGSTVKAGGEVQSNEWVRWRGVI